MTQILVVLALLPVASLAQDAPAPDAWKQYARPEAAGFASAALEEARVSAERLGSAAVFVVVDGHALLAWGEVDRPLECHSVRKSLVSALIGIHAARGTIDLDATVGELGIDDEPPLSDTEKEARVRDLLAARSGVYHPAAKEPDDMKAERPERGAHAPGEWWWYNNWDFNVVGVVLERALEEDLFAAFQRDLARPLGMEDFRLEHGLAEFEPSSSIHPAHAFRMSARDLARFGWLFACGGSRDGRSIVPSSWVAESTRVHSELPGGRGFGWMWWVYPAGTLGKDLPALDRHDAFAAVGTGGQLVLVVPAARFVFVHRVDTRSGRSVRGGPVWALAERVLAARTLEPAAEPELVPLEPVPLAGAIPAPPERKSIPLPAELGACAGEYLGEDESRVDIHVWRGRLFALAHGLGETELFAEAPDAFFSKAADLQVRFERDAAGKVVGMVVDLMGRELGYERLL